MDRMHFWALETAKLAVSPYSYMLSRAKKIFWIYLCTKHQVVTPIIVTHSQKETEWAYLPPPHYVIILTVQPKTDREQDENVEDDVRQRATGLIGGLGCCGENTASVHGAHTRPSEIVGRPANMCVWTIHHRFDASASKRTEWPKFSTPTV